MLGRTVNLPQALKELSMKMHFQAFLRIWKCMCAVQLYMEPIYLFMENMIAVHYCRMLHFALNALKKKNMILLLDV